MSDQRIITSINSRKLGDTFEYRGVVYKITSFPDEYTIFGLKVSDNESSLSPGPDTVRVLITELL